MTVGHEALRADGEVSAPRGYEDYEISLGDLMRGERATLGKSLLDVQRELKIKAAYIAAIENADPGVFETPGFIAGYVRSYARYLGLDPDRAFAGFCAESGFEPAHGMSAAASAGRRPSPQAPVTLSADRDIFADRQLPYVPSGDAMLSRIEPGAIGSVAVLLALIGAVGWGGWSMLQELQRVTVAPVDDAPLAAEIDPLAPSEEALAEAPEAGPPELDALDRLYRPRALDVPVLVARDGPIAALDPDPGPVPGSLAEPGPVEEVAEVDLDPRRDQIAPPRVAAGSAQDAPAGIEGAVRTALSGAQEGAAPTSAEADGAAPADEAPQVVAEAGDEVVLVAARPSWVRVRSADGTVVLEKIMEAGETFAVERTEAPATLRTGNAGALYFSVGGRTFGPAGEGPTVVSDVALSPEALSGSYALADLSDDPELERMVRVADAAPEAEGTRPAE